MTARPEGACPTPSLSSADMTSDPPDDPTSAPADGPADELPIVKVSLDPDRPDVLTDVTGDVGDIRFDAGYSYGFSFLQQARNVTGRQSDPVPVSILDEASVRLDGVRPGESRTALWLAALDGTPVQVEFYPDGDGDGAIKISAQCLVTRTSLRARGKGSRYWRLRPNDDDNNDDRNEIWRDDDFELTVVSDATCERIEHQ